MKISVIVISRNEGEYLRATIDNLEDTLPPESEIVVIDDGSTDGSAEFLKPRYRRTKLIGESGIGVTRSRNLGARSTSGRILVFADAHIALAPHWWKPLCDLLDDPAVGAAAPAMSSIGKSSSPGYGLTFKGPSLEVRWLRRAFRGSRAVPILPGACLAMRRDVFEATGGWDEGLLHRGNVDNEFAVRHWLLGYELKITSDAVVGHLFRKESPYPVGWPQFLQNRLRLPLVHFNPPRINKVVRAMCREPQFPRAILKISESDVARRRVEMNRIRKRDDDWLFDRFGWKW